MHVQFYNTKIWVLKQPIDFRCAIDGLSNVVINRFGVNPNSAFFVFYNKHKDKLKCLTWHKNGFILLYKRLEEGKFKFCVEKYHGKWEISIEEFEWLLAGLEWQYMSQWRELNYEKFS